MWDNAVGGDDTLIAGDGALSDALFGDAQSLFDASVGGNDTLISGTGSDLMWGDAETVAAGATTGADVFVFAPGSNLDTIYDFEQGQDLIDVSAYGYTDFDELVITGDGNVVDFDETPADLHELSVFSIDGSEVTLVESDFIFAA